MLYLLAKHIKGNRQTLYDYKAKITKDNVSFNNKSSVWNFKLVMLMFCAC